VDSKTETPLYERIPSMYHGDDWWVRSVDFKKIETVLHKLAGVIKERRCSCEALSEYQTLMNEKGAKE
jgi:hypothetical protein